MLKLNHTLAQLSSVSFLLKGENRFSNIVFNFISYCCFFGNLLITHDDKHSPCDKAVFIN